MSMNLEQLEPRVLLAAGVTFAGGVLTIEGTADDNPVTIIAGPNGVGSVDVTADVDGVAGDEIVNAIFNGVTDIKFKLLGGDDDITIDGVEISGGINVEDKLGDNTLTITGTSQIGKNVIVKTGTGTDTVTIDGDSVIGGNVNWSDDGGDDNEFTATDADIFGNLEVKFGKGNNDDATIATSDVHGNAGITDGGGGGSDVAVTGLGVHGLGIGGKLSVTTGKENDDNTTLSATRVGNGVTIKDQGGQDNDHVIAGTIVVGKTEVSNSNGNLDSIALTGPNTFVGDVNLKDLGGNHTAPTVAVTGANGITGKLDIATGNGLDTVTVTGASVGGGAKIADGGGAANTISVTTLTAPKLEINTRSGTDTVSVITSLIGTGGAKINTLQGNDIISISGSSFGGLLSIDTQSGNDDVTFLAGNSVAKGVTVKLGAGDDELDVLAGQLAILGQVDLDGGSQIDRINLAAAIPVFPAAKIKNFEIFGP